MHKKIAIFMGSALVSILLASESNAQTTLLCAPIKSWNKLIEKNMGKNTKKLLKKIEQSNTPSYSTYDLFLGSVFGIRTANVHDYLYVDRSKQPFEYFYVVNERIFSNYYFTSSSLEGKFLEIPINGTYKVYDIYKNTTSPSNCDRLPTGFLSCFASSEAIFKIDEDLFDYMVQQPEKPYIEARFKKTDGSYARCPRYLYSGEFRLLKAAITP